ncbi:MFS transporter [Aestuariibius sp. 2305UL40-4]|uniref:MFS transporter n=1 Tax=Aestuariibius violaceus TaxID=3234132 RepID=UPI00345E7FD9
MGTRFSALAALATAGLFFLYEFVARIEPSIATGEISDDLGLSATGFGLISSLFFWTYAPMQLVVGLLLDRYGLRRFVLPAILACASGTAMVGLASTPVVAGAGRVLTGFGASFAFVSALFVVNHWFAPQRFALLSGLVNAIGMTGAAIGAVVLTEFVSVFGWRQTFVGTGLAGLVLFAFAVVVLHDPPRQAEDKGTLTVLRTLGAVITQGRIWLFAVVGALMYIPINVFGGLWGNAELIADHHLSSMAAETAIAAMFFGMAAGSVAAGALSDWLGNRKWIMLAGSLAAAMIWTLLLYSESGSPVLLNGMLFAAGLFGGAQMLTFAGARDGQPPSVVGTIVAFVNMIGIGAALLFQPLVGLILDLTGGLFAEALSVLPAALLAACVLILFVRSETVKGDARP